MLIEAQELQDEAVDNLIEAISKKNDVFFEAPTGSGKTHMMADLMNRVLGLNNDVVFIVSSLSKGDLAAQNYYNFEKYSDYEFTEIDPFLIDSDNFEESRLDIEVGHNVYVLPRDLFKEKSKLMEGGVFISFLKELHNMNKVVYLIKDECHIKTGKLDSVSEYFDKTISFSATLNLGRGQYPDVFISEQDAVNTKLIKSVEYMPYKDEYDNEASLDEALKFFEEKKIEYTSKSKVTPCMIIQISNKEKAEEEWTVIRRVLEKKHNGLKWMLIVNKGNKEDSIQCDTNDEIKKKKVPVSKWKNYAKLQTSSIDVIIFKMVISEGWDIPRACMLFQIRDTQSKQLDEQVIGRVRRNPLLMDFDRAHEEEWDFALKAYVWGIKDNSKKKRQAISLKNTLPPVSDEIRVKTTLLKDVEEEKHEIKSIIESVIEDEESVVTSKSIFDLYRGYYKTDNEIKDGCRTYLTEKNLTVSQENQQWLSIMRNIDAISRQITSYRCNYDSSMYAGPEVSLPTVSEYEENIQYMTSIDDWLWVKKNDPYNTEFSFDSMAEKEWADKLQSLSRRKNNLRATITKTLEECSSEEDVYVWGKNFVNNSDIKFQYFLHGIHTSYPDFILKDNYDRIHLFEVKSVNKAVSMSIDTSKYKDKIEALKNCYKFASGITGYDFWIPIKTNNDWDIFHFCRCKEEQFTFEQFKDYLKMPPISS